MLYCYLWAMYSSVNKRVAVFKLYSSFLYRIPYVKTKKLSVLLQHYKMCNAQILSSYFFHLSAGYLHFRTFALLDIGTHSHLHSWTFATQGIIFSPYICTPGHFHTTYLQCSHFRTFALLDICTPG